MGPTTYKIFLEGKTLNGCCPGNSGLWESISPKNHQMETLVFRYDDMLKLTNKRRKQMVST